MAIFKIFADTRNEKPVRVIKFGANHIGNRSTFLNISLLIYNELCKVR